MRFDPEALRNKETHLDRVLELPWVVDEVLQRHLAGPFSWTPLERVWEPGGGSTLLKVDDDGRPLLLKVKHETVWIESALESEAGFPRKPSLANEHAFLSRLRGPWLPRVRFFDEEEGFQLLALEWLEPFDVASERLGAGALITAWHDLQGAVRSLFDSDVVHTDLHEGNLCFRGDQIVIVDFEEARRLPQSGAFETSLDVCGETALGNVGAFPVADDYSPRWTCLARLEQVFRERVRAKLPALLERCSYDRDCDFNCDPLQAPDPRIYQSVSIGDVEIEGQRPHSDGRVDVVCSLLRGLARELGPIRHLDVGSNLGAFCIAAARESSVARSIGVEASPEFVEAARALAFVQGADVEFHERVCGRDPLARDFSDVQVVTLLSVYHHIEWKDAFLADLARLSPEVVIAEMASQDRFYPERGSLAAERREIQQALGLPHAAGLASSRDYARPIWVFSRQPLSLRTRLACRLTASDVTGLPRRSARRARRLVRRAGRAALRPLRAATQRRGPRDLREALEQALAWLNTAALPDGGLAVSNVDRNPYPEVTGYTIPTLMAWGQHERAAELANWLVSIQNEDGSWSAPSSTNPYTFDSGQILKGLMAVERRSGGFGEPLRRGCDWLLTQIDPEGRVGTPDRSYWELPGGGRVPDSIHLYALEPLLEVAAHFDAPEYRKAARRAVAHYRTRSGLIAADTLSHFHAYVLEALVDLGEHSLARAGLAQVALRQRRDGAIPAYPEARWVCVPAVAQYAVAWYELGQREPADRAFAFMRAQQRKSGGFVGSVGPDASYFPRVEITWAAKFFLDAAAWHIRRRFDADADQFPSTVEADDPRLVAVLRELPLGSSPRILDAGCGKGRFARALAERRPDAEIVGVDLSDALLGGAPSSVETRCGSLLDLPCADDEFDFAFCVEALEHVVDPAAAVAELLRVVRPGGTVLIVDKDALRAGALPTADWERWLERGQVKVWLGAGCEEIRAQDLNGPGLPEGLFVAWRGRVSAKPTR
jgi:malonyl-CoA O-methyltransferase